MAIRVTPLGAGQQVGRSCILVEIAGARVLFDCGVNPGDKTARHFPELEALVEEGGRGITEVLDAVIISHYHLDHVGALPYLTEVLGYAGPLLMSHPTRAIAPVILHDYLRLCVEVGNVEVRYTAEAIGACFARATCLQLHERVALEGGLVVTPYYAGHVLGATMVLLEHRGRSVLYTGDFTTVSEHYLSAARVPLALRPDVLITETTCCTTIRTSKRSKEQEFCRKVQDTLDNGGKVLMPISLLGRAQEMCLMLDKHWARAGLRYPIYVLRGMGEEGLKFFRLFASWSSDLVRKTEEPFNFAHVRASGLEEVIDSDSPMVVLAGPSMLQGGASLRCFRKWAPDRKNLVSFAGFCLPGTIGNEVQGKIKEVSVGAGVTVAVRCAVDFVAHSDHTDERGILHLISQVVPRRVVLVHGSAKLMQTFRPIVERRLGVPCSDPAVGECAELFAGEPAREVLVSPVLVLGAQPVPAPPAPPVPRNAKLELLPACFPPAAACKGLLLSRKRKAEEALELLEPRAARAGRGTASASSVGSGPGPHRLRYRHEVPSLALKTFHAAWVALLRELQGDAMRHRWQPAEPRWDAPLPSGQQYTLSVLSAMECHLTPARGKAQIRLVVHWPPADEDCCAAVGRFLGALGAG